MLCMLFLLLSIICDIIYTRNTRQYNRKAGDEKEMQEPNDKPRLLTMKERRELVNNGLVKRNLMEYAYKKSYVDGKQATRNALDYNLTGYVVLSVRSEMLTAAGDDAHEVCIVYLQNVNSGDVVAIFIDKHPRDENLMNIQAINAKTGEHLF